VPKEERDEVMKAAKEKRKKKWMKANQQVKMTVRVAKMKFLRHKFDTVARPCMIHAPEKCGSDTVTTPVYKSG
jgi:hypothetical protein